MVGFNWLNFGCQSTSGIRRFRKVNIKRNRQSIIIGTPGFEKRTMALYLHVISVSITTNIMIAIGIPLWHGWLNELITVNHTTSSDLRSLVTLIFSVACYQAKSQLQYKSLTILPLLFRVILGTVFRLITSHFQQWF